MTAEPIASIPDVVTPGHLHRSFLRYAGKNGGYYHARRLRPEDYQQIMAAAAGVYPHDYKQACRFACQMLNDLIKSLPESVGGSSTGAWKSQRCSRVAKMLYHGWNPDLGYANRNSARASLRNYCEAHGIETPAGMSPTESGKLGSQIGCTARWGDWQSRRAKALAMHAMGASLEEIREACGYRSVSGAHYAVKSAKPIPPMKGIQSI